MKRYTYLVIVTSLLVVGCAGSRANQESTSSLKVTSEHCASALAEAFDLYAAEVTTAAVLDYTSQAEATAVVVTLSEARFDWQLRQALARRGLTKASLAHFAETHPVFFHEQQRLHWGRLQQIEQTLATIPLRVRPSPSYDESLLAVGTSTPSE